MTEEDNVRDELSPISDRDREHMATRRRRRTSKPVDASDEYLDGFADGLEEAAKLVDRLRDTYTTPAASAALGLAHDELLTEAAQARGAIGW